MTTTPAPTSSTASRDATAALRVVVFQGDLLRYRLPVFAELAARPEIDLTVVHGTSDQAYTDRSAIDTTGFRAQRIPMKHLTLLGRTLHWHPPQYRYATPEHADVVILPWDVSCLTLVPAIRRAKRRGVGVVLWGHGYSKREASWRKRIRDTVGRMADAVLVYNHTAARQLDADNVAPGRTFVALNTIEQTPIQDARRDWLSRPDDLRAFQVERGLDDRPVVLFISRLYPDNRVDLLIDAVAKLRSSTPDARLVIVGNGPAREMLAQRARDRGVEDAVLFPGAIYGEPDLAPWMLSADVFCYPVNVGLSMLHAFGYGVPAVTSDRTEAQNPEIEALQPGVNGQVYRDNDPSDLARVLGELLSDDDARQRMSEAAHRTATEQFTLENMVDGMVAAVRAAADRARRKSR